MKIIASGWNYREHNKEMNHSFFLKEPVIFLKPDSALLKDGKPFFIPDFSQNIQYEAEIVVRINRLGKNIAAKFAHRYYEEVTIGIDFTARDLQQDLRKNGNPWEISKGFDNSAVIGKFVSIDKYENMQNISFSLYKNQTPVQQGNTRDMIFSINELIEYISRFFTLKIGDLIFTGTPDGVGRVNREDHLEGFINDEKLLDFYTK